MNIAAIGGGPAGAQGDLYESMASVGRFDKSILMQWLRLTVRTERVL
jgi:hypothetical protein